ncbi:DUF4199 domain-containing protein [Carboxylicivirga caseinilyticus]|uniref:DUF4199 domain-containing protein n=1 Tax=Carboxylicivirga caseinilyticus TaxID=3417572 RepID=UPI003D341F9C|nr:DUF4199 domain-containing protein [Marinilabiliaceae bacterium A049]
MSKFRIEIKWAITFFAVIILWTVFEKMIGLHDEHIDIHAKITNLFAIPAILIYILALLEKRRKDFNDKMTWLQGFVSGLIITFIVALLSPLSQVLTHEYLSPQYFDNIIAYSVKNNLSTQVEAEGYFNLTSYIYMSVVGALMMGFITSAVVAFFVKKK